MTARLTILLGTDNGALHRAFVARMLPGTDGWLWPEVDHGEPIHPKHCGDLADKAIAKSGALPVLVATHAETFVLRVQLRVAEGTLAPSDVAFFFVETNGMEEPIPIDDGGHPKHGPWLIGEASFVEASAMARIDLDPDHKDKVRRNAKRTQ